MSEYYTFEEPPPLPPRRDDDHLHGAGWYAHRTAAGCVLSWDGGGIQSRTVEVSISEAEFARLRRRPDSFAEISAAHDPVR